MRGACRTPSNVWTFVHENKYGDDSKITEFKNNNIATKMLVAIQNQQKDIIVPTNHFQTVLIPVTFMIAGLPSPMWARKLTEPQKKSVPVWHWIG